MPPRCGWRSLLLLGLLGLAGLSLLAGLLLSLSLGLGHWLARRLLGLLAHCASPLWSAPGRLELPPSCLDVQLAALRSRLRWPWPAPSGLSPRGPGAGRG